MLYPQHFWIINQLKMVIAVIVRDQQKEKIKSCSNERKIQILTLVLEDQTIQKTVEFFKVSEHKVRHARKLKKEKGILATPDSYSRGGSDKETKKSTVKSYERNDVIRLCPSKKDCSSIRNLDCLKEKIQKRPILANISKIFLKYMPISKQNFLV